MNKIIKFLRTIRNLENPLVRDFTETAETEMVKMAKENDDFDDLFSQNFLDNVGRYLDKEGLLDILYGVNNYQKNVIDYYNYSAKNIEDICGMARDCDSYYGSIISEYTQISDNVYFLIVHLAECLDPSSSYYLKKQAISDRLINYKYKQFDGIDVASQEVEAQNARNSALRSIVINDEDVIDYCANNNKDFFKEYTEHIFVDEMDFDALDIVFLATGTVIYKGVEMTIDEMIGILSKEGYSEKMIRRELSSLISSVISTNNNATTFMKEHKEAKIIVEGLIKNYLNNESDNEFKDFVNAIGGIDLVKKIFDKSPEVLDYLFTDYKNGLEIINQLNDSCVRSGSVEMRLALENIRADYINKWAGVLRKVEDFSVTQVNGITEDMIQDFIKKECGESSILTSVLNVYEVKENVDSTHKLIALKKIDNELQKSYEDIIDKINSGSYTQEDLSAAKNIFNLIKENTISIYETYRDSCTGNPEKQIYCNKQIEKLQRVNMKYYSTFNFEA